MTSSRQSALYVLGIVAVAIVGSVGLATAKSRPSQELDGRCSARVKELEAEVLSLRKQLHSLADRDGNTPVTMASSSKASRIGAVAQHSKNDPSASCDPPFGYDQQGIKFYRPGCLDSSESDSCSVPYAYTSAGIKIYKPSCLDTTMASSTACDSPFSFDAQGIKSYKPECL